MTDINARGGPALRVTVPARKGLALVVAKGSLITVINTHGHQVVDTWAFSAVDPTEFMSMEHSRVAMLKLIPATGDTLVTNRRRPILKVAAESSPGVHDTLVAACDSHRYVELGGSAEHDNCTDNLAKALKQIGRAAPCTPCPLNLFMNVQLTDGRLDFQPPLCEAGDSISLRAEMDLVVVFSACPQDLTPVNGHDPCEVDVMISEPATARASEVIV